MFEFDVENDGFGNGDNRFYAGSAARGEELHFSLPEGDYRALMFLGTKSGLRLLATGAVTGVKDADKYLQEDILDGLFKITREVRTIEFTVSSLVSDIEEGALTFSSPVYKNGFDNITTVLDGGMVPYFNIPSAVQLPYTEEGAIKGTFAFSGFPDTLTPGGDAVELGAVTPAKDAWLDLVNDKTTMIQTIGVLAYNRKTESELAPVPVTGTVQYVRLLYGKLRIDFGLKTSESPELKIGFNKLQFFASVQAFKNGDGLGDKGDVWRIANGFRAEELDLGGSSMGQNILLMVGKPEEMTDLVDIVITSVDADAAEPFYVSNIGNDDANGSKMNPFRTLLTAYEAASADDKRKTIAVMTDLEKDDAVELAITNDLTITIRGVDVNNPPALTRTTGTDDSVINISGGAKVKFQNITIDGKVGGANRALHVSGEGTKVTLVRGATITGEAESSGGGVLVDAGAWFVLNGGEIVDSVSGEIGGGVYVSGSFLTSTLFTMYSGKISRNTASGSIGGAGGGVFIRNATFMMSGGEISGNEVSGADDSAGGGVYITGGFTTFEMTGGVISGNTSSGGGGGVSGGNLAKFNMYDGVIYGPNATPEELANTAAFNGGATYFPDSASGNMNITLDATIRFDSSGAIVVE